MSTESNEPQAPPTSDDQALGDRGDNRSHRPNSEAFRQFMGSNWGERTAVLEGRQPVADFLNDRHRRAGAPFPGERLVIPAGGLQVRSNDTDYRFRAHSAFAHMTGLGAEMEPDAVLVLEPTATPSEGDDTHTAVLYFQPRSSRSSEQFYADSRYGEFWVGPRPSLEEMSAYTGLACAPIDTLPDALAKDAGTVPLRVLSQADDSALTLVNRIRQNANLPEGAAASALDDELAQHLSEIRLIKDSFEVDELQHAVDVTRDGFDEIIRSLPRAAQHHRGERVIEGAFAAVAREQGNGVGYETIAASGNHANTLHWIDNSGALPPGGLVLVDAGVEVDSLYTADITRTLPISGRFTDAQERVYQAVLDAAEAALAACSRPGVRFKDVHQAAMEVIARRLEEWGILPVTAEQSLAPDGQQHRRWMPHGTSHHLGLDVHDCAQARREMYQEALLEPGMTFTIEPGLYFREDDLAVPAELRGIGVRIEDDIVIEADGMPRRFSESIPRTIKDVEAWMANVWAQ